MGILWIKLVLTFVEDECDLDVLVSLLDDDSNSGDVKQRDPPDNKSVGKGNGNSPQSSTLTKGPQPANEGLVD